jgi:hypothetical protein
MNCPCKCHQDKNELTNCGKCNNTGIKHITRNLEITNPLLDKPIYLKTAKDLVDSKTLRSLRG